MAAIAERSPRKAPQQARSRLMRARILEASLRVLRDEGALGFTTTRVASEAGISVGSLYQYFPNKHALVAAMHEQDQREGWDHIASVLDRRDWSGQQRVEALAQWFFASETDEVATMGTVDGDIDVFLREGTVDGALYEVAVQRFASFVSEVSATSRSRGELRFAAEFMMVTIESVGKSVARRQLNPAGIREWASNTARMICTHLAISDEAAAVG
jgi:AcrR family transcriptional regulator